MQDVMLNILTLLGLITVAAGVTLFVDHVVHKLRSRHDGKIKRFDKIEPLIQPVFTKPGEARPEKQPVWVSPRERRVQAAATILAAEHVKVGRGIRWHRISVRGRMDKEMASAMRAGLSDALTRYFNARQAEADQ